MDLDESEIKERINIKIQYGEKKYGKDFKFLVLDILNLEKMIMPQATIQKEKEPIPLARWNDYHDFPTVKALRQYYFNRAKNGFDYCIEYGGENGGTILINEDKYFTWRKERAKFRSK